MTSIASRYTPHVLVLTLLALVPVVVHSYAALRDDDCASPAAFIPNSLTGASKLERDAWMRATYRAFAWREGLIPIPGSAPLSWAIVRTHDAKRVYHRPESVFVDPGPTGSVSRSLEWIESRSGASLPVQRIRISSGMQRERSFASYLLIYQGEPVANPYLAQLRAAPSLALRGSVPMTLLLVYGRVVPELRDAAQERGDAWLVKAYRDYQLACGVRGGNLAERPA